MTLQMFRQAVKLSEQACKMDGVNTCIDIGTYNASALPAYQEGLEVRRHMIRGVYVYMCVYVLP